MHWTRRVFCQRFPRLFSMWFFAANLCDSLEGPHTHTLDTHTCMPFGPTRKGQDTADDAKGAQRRLLADVRVRGLHQTLHLAGQIPGHFRRGDRTKSAQGQAYDELRRAVQVAGIKIENKLVLDRYPILLEHFTYSNSFKIRSINTMKGP